MGIWYKVYAGPVLVCTYHIIEKFESLRSCKNPDCGVHKKKRQVHGRFCSACGQEAGDIQITKRERSVHRGDSALEDGGFRGDELEMHWGTNCEPLDGQQPLTHLLTPTDDEYLGRELSRQADQFNVVASGIDIADELKKTEEKYAAEIAFLRTVYDTVKLEWMVLTSGS